jgi:hypothetical protein
MQVDEPYECFPLYQDPTPITTPAMIARTEGYGTLHDRFKIIRQIRNRHGDKAAQVLERRLFAQRADHNDDGTPSS